MSRHRERHIETSIAVRTSASTGLRRARLERDEREEVRSTKKGIRIWKIRCAGAIGDSERTSWNLPPPCRRAWRGRGSFLNARKWLFYNAVFRSFFNAPGVISQRARAVTSKFRACSRCVHFATRHGSNFLFPRFLGFLVSGSLGFWVSWFLGLLVPRFLGFWVSWFLGFSLSCCRSFLFGF